MRLLKKTVSFLPASFLTVLLLLQPDIGKNAAFRGVLLCGNVVIPSLFPFMVCVLFLLKRGLTELFGPLESFTKYCFHISAESFGIFFLSAIGGYPTGAKLLNESVKADKISPKSAGIMLCYSVCAGPAFILLAVGNGLFHSKIAGGILLFSHLFSALLLAFLAGFFLKEEPKKSSAALPPPLTECFVLSVAEAAKAVLSICAYVVFFSVFSAFWRHWFQGIPLLREASGFWEITCGLTETKNIRLVSFLLGFAGLSVWCQIFSLAKNIPIRYGVFILARCLHGALSLLITASLLAVFPVSLQVANRPAVSYTYDGAALSFAMLMMAVIFLLSLFSRAERDP